MSSSVRYTQQGLKIIMSMQGKNHSQQTREKMSKSAKGNKVWVGRKHTPEARLKMSEAQKKSYQNGRVSNFKGKPPHNKGGTLSKETKLKISAALRGEKNHRWRGGITSSAYMVRHSLEYKWWRDEIYKRDNNRCVMCGIQGERDSPYLIVDHIKSFHYFPELRLEISNGRVLCRNCHSQTETYGGNVHKVIK